MKVPRGRRAGVVLWLLIAVAASPETMAQAGAGVLSGSVRDYSGAAVPDALITATHTATKASRTALTTDAGTFTIAGLSPGAYGIVVTRAGFRTLERANVRILTGETSRFDFELAVDSVEETITVTPRTFARTDSAGLGQVIGHEQVAELPLHGRSFITLAALTPGVALPPGSLLPRINGGRPRTNEYLFDGISVLQPEPGQVAFFPLVDAIHEFKIESNSPPAEFGRFNGGVVNLTTRSGANTLDGGLFEFLRHEALNGRNVFAPKTAARPAKPLFRRHQFGGFAGGPIVRDRTFFFVDYQGVRQKTGRLLISTVPTLLQRQGIFTEAIGGHVVPIYDPLTTTSQAHDAPARAPFAGNSIPAERIDPVARTLLERYPLPTEGGTSNNYRRLANERASQNQYDIRIDHGIAGSERAFARLSHARDETLPATPLPDGSGSLTSGATGPTKTSAWSLASGYQHVFGANVLHELRIGYTRRSVSRRGAALRGQPSADLGLPGIPTNGRFSTAVPAFVIDGYQQIGSPPNTHSEFGTDVTQVVDTLVWTQGRHTWKAGIDFRWPRLDILQPPSPTGSFRFSALFTDLPGAPGTGSALASFLLGQVQTFSIDLQARPIRPRAHIQEYFVQDDWTAKPGLTIHAGIRYTLNFPSTEADDQAAVFNLDTRQIEFLGRDGHARSARELHKLNFGPRLSISARPTDRTTIRTGYGLIWIEQTGITTPFTTPQFPFVQAVTQRTLDNRVPAFVLAEGPTVAPIPLTPDAGLGQGVFAVDRDLGSGYVQQWHLAVQRALTTTASFEMAYVGSKITRVGIPDTNLNQLTKEQLVLGPALLQQVSNPFFGKIPRSSSLGDPTIPLAQLLKPYPEYSTVSLYRNNVGTTIYHGLEVKLEQRPLRGWSYLVSYTRSRLVDDASSVFDASILTGPIANFPVADSFNRKLERDVSTGDIPHVFVASVLWEMPWGTGRPRQLRRAAGALLNDWAVAAILNLQSGTPRPVTRATNFNAFAGFGTQRPNRRGDPSLPADERTPSRWFNTDAFTVAPQFTIGNSSRNPVRGPSYRNLDLALIRRIAVRETEALEIRAEAFNLTNTPPLGAPNTILGTPGFGSITSAGDPRVVQLAVKVLF